MNWHRSALALVTLATALGGAHADDTEIYLGVSAASEGVVKPNVLFIIDTSGSMSQESNLATPSRMDEVRSALNAILDSAQDVRVGLSRFTNPGGPILYPISDLASDVTTVESGDIVVKSRIRDGLDDAEEDGDGNVTTDSASLELVVAGGEEAVDPSVPDGSDDGSEARLTFDNAVLNGVTKSGTWQDSTHTKPFFGTNYMHDQNTGGGKSVTFTPRFTIAGEYDVYLHWTEGSNRASNVPVTINHAGGSAAVTVNERTDGSQWNLIGSYSFNTGTSHSLVISNDGADGYVIVDGVHFQRVSSSDTATQTVGLRFEDLHIPQGATISNASIRFTATQQDTNTALMLTVTGEKSSDAAAFSATTNDISDRPRTTASVSWTPSAWQHAGDTDKTADLTTIVQEIVDQAGWCAGNSMAFFITGLNDELRRIAFSYDGDHTLDGIQTLAPQLNISYDPDSVSAGACGSDEGFTVRTRLKEMVDELPPMGGTPLVDTLYEAALYFRGEGVLYGADRGKLAYYNPQTGVFTGTDSQLRACSDYDISVNNNNCKPGHWSSTHLTNRVSHPDTYSGSNNRADIGCLASDLGDDACTTEEVAADATYVSPITEPCQTSHIVLLSDGDAADNPNSSLIRAMTGDSSCSDSGNEACGPELAKFLYTEDQSSGLGGEQNVITHTIAFHLGGGGEDYLAKLADWGGGGAYKADNAVELVNAFEAILAEIQEVNTTFIAPAVSVSSANRMVHDDTIFFALFRPSRTTYWPGNLKRYRLTGSPAQIVDVNGDPAVDETTGFFTSSSQSWWSDSADGDDIASGGAAHELTVGANRSVYTYTGSSSTLSNATNAVSEDNDAITKAMLGDSSMSDDRRSELLQWLRGVDVNDADHDGQTTDARRELGDPMHARPVLVQYATNDDDTLDRTVFFMSNDGFIHAFDVADGSEEFAYIPRQLLPNVKEFFDDGLAVSGRVYGMDGPLVAWAKGGDDGTISGSDKVYLYAGMRRGGRSYHALDVTDRDNPKILWTIGGGSENASGDDAFDELGQTWSTPVLTRVDIGGTEKDVLIFGGGYDPDQDSAETRSEDDQGRAIYMVDAVTGARLWSVGPDNSHTENLNSMDYSIPSEVRVIDVDGDHLADLMLVGDMGGRIWRFDISNGSNTNNLVDGGIIADFNGGDASGNRRFYYPPDAALMRFEGDLFLSIAVGSGWRAHPLDTIVQDRFYVLRDSHIYSAPSSYTTLTEDDLYDITENHIGQGSDAQKEAALDDLVDADGWYLQLESSGEKVLAEALTADNQIVFTTYIPGTASSVCSAVVGSGRTYLVSLLDGTPQQDLDDSGSEPLTKEDRYVDLKRGGIPPEPILMFPDGSPPVLHIGPEQPFTLNLGSLRKHTYWREIY